MPHLDAENTLLRGRAGARAQLRDELFTELKGRIKEDDNSVPYRENGYWYHHRYEEGKEYPIHVRREDEAGAGPKRTSSTRTRWPKGSPTSISATSK